MARLKKPKQQTLEDTLGKPRLGPQKIAPKANLAFEANRGDEKQTATRQGTISTGRNLATKAHLGKGRSVSMPTNASRARDTSRVPSVKPMDLDDPFQVRGSLTLSKTTTSLWPKKMDSNPARKRDGDGYGDDDDILPSPIQHSPQKRHIVMDDSDEENKDKPASKPTPVSTATKRRRLFSRAQASAAADLGSPPARHELGQTLPRSLRLSAGGNVGHGATRASRPRLNSLTTKEKKREMLRRRKARENLEDSERGSSSSESEDGKKALYDSDSDAGYAALKTFDDDEEGLPAEEEERPTVKPKGKKAQAQAKAKAKKKATEYHSSDSDDSMEDFVEDDGTLGVPDHVLEQMPLQFTSLSHKPIRKHFEDVVTWLVWFRLDPGFGDKQNQLYRIGWRKVDDEVVGLAQSKFMSSSWKPEFLRALRSRPKFEHLELSAGDHRKLEGCGACGRSTHKASFEVWFTGLAYYKRDPLGPSFLQPVEAESSSSSDGHSRSSDEDDDDEEDKMDHDENDEPIPSEDTRWTVGRNCHANAQTAHTLLHWKHSLKDLIELWLGDDGHLVGEKLTERDQETPKGRRKLVKKVLEDWTDGGRMAQLWEVFQTNLQSARKEKMDRFGSYSNQRDW